MVAGYSGYLASFGAVGLSEGCILMTGNGGYLAPCGIVGQSKGRILVAGDGGCLALFWAAGQINGCILLTESGGRSFRRPAPQPQLCMRSCWSITVRAMMACGLSLMTATFSRCAVNR
jgi:hypothetical protein